MKELKKYYLHSKGNLFLVIFIKILSAFFDVTFSAMLYAILENAMNTSEMDRFYLVGIIAFSVFICAVVFGYLEKYLTARYCNEMERLYRQDTINNILRSDYEHFNKYTAGEYTSIIQKEISNVYNWHFCCFFDLVSCAANLAIALFYSFYLNWIVTLIILLLSIVIVAEPVFLMKKLKELNANMVESSLSLAKTAENAINGAQIIKNCNSYDNVNRIIDDKNTKYKNESNRYFRFFSFTDKLANSTVLLMQLAVMFVACLLYLYGMTELAVAVAFLQISVYIYAPLGQSAIFFSHMRSVSPIVKEIASITAAESAKSNNPSTLSTITLKHLSLKTESKTLYDDVDYTFEVGKKYLLVGESGTGKTSLLNALIGNKRDYDGEIFFNDVSEKELSDEDLNSNISYCYQMPFLFVGSLLDNITLYEEKPNLDKVNELIKLCKLDKFVETRGLDNVLDNNENTVSLGEMQRISLARALYFDKPVLFLDEVTSSVDAENATEIFNVIKDIKGKLIIWISHQSETTSLDWIDKTLLLEDMKLKELDIQSNGHRQ